MINSGMRNAFAASAIPGIDSLLDTVEQQGAAHFSSAERSRMIDMLKAHLINQAEREGAFFLSPDGQKLGFRHFSEREMRCLETLNKAESFSPAWNSHVRSCLNALAFRLKSGTDFACLERDWPAMSIDDKADFLRNVASLQCATFSRPGLEFHPVPIQTNSLPLPNYGVFCSGYDDMTGPDTTHIIIGNEMLSQERFSDALANIWHEQLHGIHFQLGRKALHGDIVPGHPFYNDGAMIERRSFYKAFCESYFPPPVYRSDVEERLCYATQDAFVDSCKSPVRRPPERHPV
jgi:hypothetical protein